MRSVTGLWGVSPRHVDLSFPQAFNKALATQLWAPELSFTCLGEQSARLQGLRTGEELP